MTTTTTTSTPSHDEQLRALVASGDPLAGDTTAMPQHLWARVADDIGAELALNAAGEQATASLASATSGDLPSAVRPASFEEGPTSASRLSEYQPSESRPSEISSARRPSFVRRHWQAGLLAAAVVATLALAAGTILPGLQGLAGVASDDSSTSAGAAAPDEGQAPAADAAGAGEAGSTGRSSTLERDADGAATDSAAGALSSAGGTTAAADPTLVRSGSVVIGTDDIQGGRDRFVAEVQQMGGTLVSETVSSRGDTPVTSEKAIADSGVSYPWYPSGPGIWLTVKVPAASYDQAMAAARSTGQVVQLQQSSYDVGAQVTDVRARIAVLTASLKRLDGLMDDANSVADVIRLENAIAERQSELDSLLAQQRDLADQTEMSQISLTLMSPDDAQQTVDPEPQLTWWESFVRGLSQFWSWLGQALLILSPLLVVGAILLWVRRRRGRRGPTSPAEPASADAA